MNSHQDDRTHHHVKTVESSLSSLQPTSTQPPTKSDIHLLSQHLTTQASTLLSELTAFRAFLENDPLISRPDILVGRFQADVKREVEYLRKHVGAAGLDRDGLEPSVGGSPHDANTTSTDNNEDAVTTRHLISGRQTGSSLNHTPDPGLDGLHRIRSSNISFLAGVWESLKQKRGVVGVRRNVRYHLPVASNPAATPAESEYTQSKAGALSEPATNTNQINNPRVSKKMNREARERAKQEKEKERQHPKKPMENLLGATEGEFRKQDSHDIGTSMFDGYLKTEVVNAVQSANDLAHKNIKQPHEHNSHDGDGTSGKQDHPSATNEGTTVATPFSVPIQPNNLPHRTRESVTVDIIADHGATWIKLFTKTQRWLLMDLAKEGMVDIESDEDEDDVEREEEGRDHMSTTIDERKQNHVEEIENNSQKNKHQDLVMRTNGFIEHDDKREQNQNGGNPTKHTQGQQRVPFNAAMEELKIIKMAREFLQASKTTRVGPGHRHPTVQFHLPKISRGETRDVDKVLMYLENIGVQVIVAEDLEAEKKDKNHEVVSDETLISETRSILEKTGRLSLQETFNRMIRPAPAPPITGTLNVDCTILIALTSDISHSRLCDVIIPEHYKGIARRDIEVQLQTDIDDPLLTNHIYSVLRGRRLICTKKATEHWRNIVKIMGSPSEAERSKIFLGETEDDELTLSSHERLQKLSIHKVPEDLQIPFEIVDFDLDKMNASADDSHCQEIEMDVMKALVKEPRLSSLNSSVFFHGWYKSLTTVSLNRVVSEWLRRAMDAVLNDMETEQGRMSDIAEYHQFCGPNILICGRERSLLGSEK